ncbi:tetraprenyl-beta-curcumene synthase [Ruminiclostridium hungatei]|uniref:Tetraprenyl-beta-curcumene synthase n=1 Tax=Ruminiclostridium hungatei TaxID=48256 RepID=A0A1V4SPP5_RUMHU|nr:DUF2600 family protein [Ruminiclostridium hungatei]OPX45832.1 tetraprenyl-beta-curcumene synthase [Ruminiclostridium hungatei]
MVSFIRSLSYSKKYNKIIYPSIEKKIREYRVYTKRIRKLSVKSTAREALDKSRSDAAVSSICLLYDNVNMELAAEVLFSFEAIVQYLNSVCLRSYTGTEPFLKLIFSSLRDALNLRTDSYENYFTFFPSKDDDGYLTILVEKCRQKVLLLPSYHVIRDHLAAFLSLFIDLQVTKFSSDDNAKEVNLINWSAAHGQKYSQLSCWEYCMAVDSTLSIRLLLAMATDPELSEQKAENLNSTFFPWICCIQKILEGYISYNDDLFAGNINYDFYYDNLKEYENRIVFFTDRALKLRTSEWSHTRTAVKLLLSIYITHPKASEGMNRITSKALLKAGGRGMSFYTLAVRLLRSKKYF